LDWLADLLWDGSIARGDQPDIEAEGSELVERYNLAEGDRARELVRATMTKVWKERLAGQGGATASADPSTVVELIGETTAAEILGESSAEDTSVIFVREG
jgi:hypothetical protein